MIRKSRPAVCMPCRKAARQRSSESSSAAFRTFSANSSPIPSWSRRSRDREKKGDKIAQELAAKNLTSVEAYAETMGSSVDSVKFVNFGTRRIAGIGIEPNLNAMVSMAQVDQVSAPVKGNNGVYVFKVYARNKDGKEFNEAEEIRALDASNAYRVGFQAIQSMVNNAKVEDNRIRFY